MSIKATSFIEDRGQKGVLDGDDQLFAYVTTREGKQVPMILSVSSYLSLEGEGQAQLVKDLAAKKGIDCRLFVKNHPGVK